MNKIVISFLLILSGSTFAQKYVPFPTENAQWNMFYASTFTGEKMDTTLLQYSLQGDTTINGIIYRKVCRNIGTNAQPIYNGIGGIREQDKRIYYFGLSYAEQFGTPFNQELLMYDFNKQIGDTVWLDYWRAENQLRISYIITKIDSVKIGNDYRKRYNDHIIEGIGDVVDGLLGMITPIPTCLDCHQEWHFICFSQNGESVYKNPDYVDCNSTQKWSEKKYLTDNSCWTNLYYNKYQYNLNGDTTLNGKSYKKVFVRTLLESSPGSGKTLYNTYEGAIREENGKIFAVLSNNSNNILGEFLLYDFTVGLGDTIKSNISKDCGCDLAHPLVVTKIDTITLLNGEKRKKFQLNYSPDWIEGVGSVSGLFYDALPLCTCIERPHLICFQQNDVQLYNGECFFDNCCDLTDGIDQIKQNTPSVKLCPNPVTGSSILKWDISDNNLFSTLVLTDVLGKNIKVLNVSGKSEMIVQRNDFTPGLYFGRLHAANGVGYVIKMIIQ